MRTKEEIDFLIEKERENGLKAIINEEDLKALSGNGWTPYVAGGTYVQLRKQFGDKQAILFCHKNGKYRVSLHIRTTKSDYISDMYGPWIAESYSDTRNNLHEATEFAKTFFNVRN
jgi:hypothetical protein